MKMMLIARFEPVDSKVLLLDFISLSCTNLICALAYFSFVSRCKVTNMATSFTYKAFQANCLAYIFGKEQSEIPSARSA